MGTPHLGSDVTKLTRTRVLMNMAKATSKKAPKRLIDALAAHSDELSDLTDSFEKTTIFTKHEIEICSYYETRSTKFVGEEASTTPATKFA
jgi:hypothetical protein